MRAVRKAIAAGGIISAGVRYFETVVAYGQLKLETPSEGWQINYLIDLLGM